MTTDELSEVHERHLSVLFSSKKIQQYFWPMCFFCFSCIVCQTAANTSVKCCLRLLTDYYRPLYTLLLLLLTTGGQYLLTQRTRILVPQLVSFIHWCTICSWICCTWRSIYIRLYDALKETCSVNVNVIEKSIKWKQWMKLSIH